MPLLQFLGLLLMALFYLLSCLVVPLLCQPLILFLLLLGNLVPFFLLLSIELFLLLLIFLVLPGITAARRRWPLVGRKFSNMAVGSRSTRRPRIILWPCVIGSSTCCIFSRLIACATAVRWRIVSSTRCLGLYHATVSVCSRLRCGSDLRLASVHRSSLLRRGSCLLHVLRLDWNWWQVSFASRSFLLGRGTRIEATRTSVVADSGFGSNLDGGFVNVVYHSDVYIVYRGVVKEPSIIPTTSFVANSEITKIIINPAIETD